MAPKVRGEDIITTTQMAYLLLLTERWVYQLVRRLKGERKSGQLVCCHTKGNDLLRFVLQRVRIVRQRGARVRAKKKRLGGHPIFKSHAMLCFAAFAGTGSERLRSKAIPSRHETKEACQFKKGGFA